MPIGSFNKSSIGSGQVTSKTISFTNQIENHVGRAAGEDGRIASTDVIDFDVMINEIEEPDKFANAVGYIPPEKPGFLESIGATLVVGFTSVLSGLGDIVEGVADGVLWVASLGAEALGEITGCEVCKDAASTLRQVIAYDVVGEANKALYGEGGILQGVNDASYMKYDSAAAQGIRKASKAVGEIALSAVTGGTAAMVIGGLEYAGAAAQTKYAAREDGDYSFHLKDELGIAAAGVGGALKGKANAALGKGYMDIFKANGFSGGLSQIWHDVGNVRFIQTAFKNAYTGKASVINWINTGSSMAPDVVGYITGTRDFNLKNVLGTVWTGASYAGQTALLSEYNNYIKNPHTYGSLADPNVLENEIKRLKENDYKTIAGYTKEQQIQLMGEIKKDPEKVQALFSNIKAKDADKLFKNISDGTTEKEIAATLAEALKGKGDIKLADLAQYGGNFQKYIYGNLDPTTQKALCESIAREYSETSILKMGPELIKIRTLFDPTDPKNINGLEEIWNNMAPGVKATFGSKFITFYNFIHESVNWYDETGKLIIDPAKASLEELQDIYTEVTT